MQLGNARAGRRVRTEQRRRQRIDRLYDSLDDVVSLLTHEPDLQDDILDWLDRADEAPAASLADEINRTLTAFQTDYAMYRTETDGEAEFPDQCEGCEHHPDACPIFTKRVWQTELERMQEELVGAPESEVRQRYRRFAGRVGCHVITDRIDAWETDHSELIAEGRDLRRRSLHIMRPADETERAAQEAADGVATAPDGGVER